MPDSAGPTTPVESLPPEKSFSVWTSMMNRTRETSEYFDENLYAIKAMRMLDEINPGECDGLTPEEIQQKYPEEFELRRRDKLHYRYRGNGGESYLDVVFRLQGVIVEIERLQSHVLLIAHRVVARILLAYYLNLSHHDISHLETPVNTLFCLEPKPYGTEVRKFEYHEGSDWFVESQLSPGGL